MTKENSEHHSTASPKSNASQTPLKRQLSGADDRLKLEHWAPPKAGIVPLIRFNNRWYSVLWALPIIFVLLVAGVAIAQGLRELASVQHFIELFPGAPASQPAIETGFPLWLRIGHFLNLVFMMFIIRSGIQILADHPRLYWHRDCTPGTEWFRFQKPVPRGQIWTAKDDAVTLPGWLGIPGVRHSIGLARWWHFSINTLWLLNGLVIYGLLFYTDQWQRIVPTTWEVFPNALSVAIQYLSLNFPEEQSWTKYNSLQQLTYFITVFIAAPTSVFTGFMQSPAISNHLGWLGRVLNRQRARSIHFLALWWFLFFILAHVTLVFITGARSNLNMMWAGVHDESWSGFMMFVPLISIVGILWAIASPLTIRYARYVQRIGAFMLGPLKGFLERFDPKSELTEADISPFLWPNGTLPNSSEYEELVANDFAHYRLCISGLVESPQEYSLAQLRALPQQSQITTHFCIQGWSGVAKWSGVPMRDILAAVRPKPEARYAVFYSLAEGSEGGRYYDCHKISNMQHKLTILALDMNDESLSVLHGAPLRLRCENELGFKMVKWVSAIEFVEDFQHLGAGHGGYNEDHEFYGYKMPI
ncbi:molybdopterin-dependent oxidoreductase [Oceanisphaera avium]|uniref:Oxidoreductase n=1 Tax=Oceanisphaera avium TaxID=1903694 RepID=A0A1Y0CXZ8_9GAMM|nr:molybdopterin-dependent oxidoreductase [Oceanisphaera avium]ART79894.1 oxidoreductase [Oceanisphaera avium]